MSTVAPAASHPLDPLTADEIRSAVGLVRKGHELGDARFPLITLREPDKWAVLAFRDGDQIDRDALVVVLDRSGATYEAVVSLSDEKVRSWRLVPGVQPSLMVEEIFLVGDIVKASPQWRDAMTRRGVTELDQVQVDPWSAGNFGVEAERGKRLVRAAAHIRKRPTDNGWAHPVEGVVALVDLNAREIVHIVEGDVVPIPSASGNFDAEACSPVRADLKPLEIVQSEGPSFEILGNEVRWQRWRLRVSLHPTEGLVLHTVGYEDGGRLRSILYRASLSDMVVP